MADKVIDAYRTLLNNRRLIGEDVGLPKGQMGNSEVGHLNIGAGRVVYQDLVKINNAFGIGSNLPGNGSPISLDALDQISVSSSPFDVRLSGFTGGAINALLHY